ncbi:amino acid ABC transporter substrate-binding protein [Ktedonobacteria bacterium brp13]|nr:amino acid ABC transporter substrate-binding protein [Ktedonobacteria bacterium brp13]
MFTLSFTRIEKAISSIIVAVMLLAGLSACTQANTFTNQTPITIGYSASLTGSFKDDGHALQQGFQLWANDVNKSGGLLGRQVKLIGLDDKSTQAQAKANYLTLINHDHVNLLLGPYSSLLAGPTAVIANKYHMAFFMPSGSAPSIYSKHLNNIFIVTLPSVQNLQAFSYYILSIPQAQRPVTVAYVSVNSPFALPQVQAAQNYLAPGHLQTVYGPKTYEPNANVTTIAQQVAASNADVAILGTSGLADSVAFVKTFKQLHYNPKAIVFTSGPNEGSLFLKAIGGASAAEGIFIPDPGWYPGAATYQADQFASEYLAQHGGSAQDISATTTEAYAAGQLLAQVVTQTHSLDQTTLINALHANTYNSLLGPLSFNKDGANTIGIPNLFQWQKGQFIPVYPNTNAEANPEYPKGN